MEKVKNSAVGKKKRAVKPRRDTVLTRVDRQIHAMVWCLAQERGQTMSRINDEAILFYFEHRNANI